jgi:hypothetical protein
MSDQHTDTPILEPLGPSSTDFDHWLSDDPVGQSMRARFKANTVTEAAGYQIWRDAWMACEVAHKIRPDLNGRDGAFLNHNHEHAPSND